MRLHSGGRGAGPARRQRPHAHEEDTAAALQAYCRSRLSDFEVPKVIHFVKELPKDSTGKVARLRLTDVFSK